jgi:hypothetical protein
MSAETFRHTCQECGNELLIGDDSPQQCRECNGDMMVARLTRREKDDLAAATESERKAELAVSMDY